MHLFHKALYSWTRNRHSFNLRLVAAIVPSEATSWRQRNLCVIWRSFVQKQPLLLWLHVAETLDCT
uniref:Uncharacterized protein n=1 Tax=Arundo donax TaxID=35708 RepID=A0A0A9FZ92_ARUDO